MYVHLYFSSYCFVVNLCRYLLCNQTSLPSLRPAVLKRGPSINAPTHPEATATPLEEKYEEVSDTEEMVTDIDTVTTDRAEDDSNMEDKGDEMARLTIEVFIHEPIYMSSW